MHRLVTPGHRPAVAPPPGHPEAGLPEPGRPAAGQRPDRSAHRATRHPEPQLGLQADPRRPAQARPPSRRAHDPASPQSAEDTPGAEAPHRYNLAAVPARARRHDARRRLLPRGLRTDAPAAVVLARDRSRQPLRPHPRGHRAPGPVADHPADPQPPAGPRRSRRGLPVPGPRPGRAAHRIIRCDPGAGSEAVTIPPPSPRANASAQRLVRTARTQVTDRMLIFGERHLRPALTEYPAHYNRRRPHRSRQLHPPRPDFCVAGLSQKQIKRRPVPGGLLNEYQRAA
jgi:putative transposase